MNPPAQRRIQRRIQRLRKKGWLPPPNAVPVEKGKWANPFDRRSIGHNAAKVLYRDYITNMILIGARDLDDLRGHDLVCSCPLNEPCHADVLIDLIQSGFGPPKRRRSAAKSEPNPPLQRP